MDPFTQVSLVVITLLKRYQLLQIRYKNIANTFPQRMLERARARQEKIDQKLANSGQAVPKRKPLTENINKSEISPSKPPAKSSRSSITSPPAKNTRSSISSPRKSSTEPLKATTPVKTASRRSSTQKPDQLVVASPQRHRNDVIVTKNEFKSPKRGSMPRRNSDVSVEINISHRNDIQIEVQVEERDAPITVLYDSQARGNNVIIKEIEGKIFIILKTVICLK